MFRHTLKGLSWRAVCDPHLLPHILIGRDSERRRWPLLAVALAGFLTILALAGPAWERLPQPVFREQSVLVLVLDLSRSMDAVDITPTRLTRARHKILDILKHRTEGYTALIVYAAEPFVVTPLTEDVGTIAALVPALSTDLMPAQGSRPDLALDEAATLIAQADMVRGQIVLLTDGVDESRRVHDAVVRLRAQGHRLSVLAIGTEGGAPISVATGGFLKDAHGSIIIPKMDESQLRTVAQEGGGRYSRFQLDDSDIEHLMAGLTMNRMEHHTEETGLHTDHWHEEGPWLLLVVLPIAALAFRRGYLVALVLVCLVFPTRAYPFDWDALWSNSNHRASHALEQGSPEQAAELFSDPQWKATAQYRAEQFDQAVTSLEGIETPDALYNKGNALARGGRFPDALKAYETALAFDDTHEDARYNHDLIEEFLEQQQRQQDGRGDESDDPQTAGNERDDEEQQSSQEQSDQQGDQQQQDGQEETQSDQDEVQQAQSDPDEQSSDSRDQTVADARDDLESQQAYEQWLRRIPDDPGGLLRRKFLYQYQQRPHQPVENTPW